MKSEPHTIYKNTLKMDLGLNVRLETKKFLEENIGRTHLTKIITIFFDLRKAKINKWDLIKYKIFYTAKETINKTKDNLKNGKKYLQM